MTDITEKLELIDYLQNSLGSDFTVSDFGVSIEIQYKEFEDCYYIQDSILDYFLDQYYFNKKIPTKNLETIRNYYKRSKFK